MRQLSPEEKAKIGKEWAEILQLKEIKHSNGISYRTSYGDKSALGVYETLNNLVYSRHNKD